MDVSSRSLVELCVTDVAGAVAARDAGCDRVELCVDVACGGTTPPDTLVAEVVEAVAPMPVQILVRCRAGGFVYSEDEVARMRVDIERLRCASESPVSPVGFVVGALTADGGLDEVACRLFREAAGERPLTFHRAFDQLPHEGLLGSVDRLVDLGYDRILTTGGHPSVADTEVLRRLVDYAAERLSVIASGGLRSHNVAGVVAATGAREVHMRAPLPHARSGAADNIGVEGTDPAEVAAIMAALTV